MLTTGRLIATLAGAALGGVLATRIGLFRALWTMGLVQLLSSLGYALAAALPADRVMISAAALFENFAAGLGTAAFLAFLMSVCERRYAASQFALLTAVYALSRWAVGLLSGMLAEQFGYASYFLLHLRARRAGVCAVALDPGCDTGGGGGDSLGWAGRVTANHGATEDTENSTENNKFFCFSFVYPSCPPWLRGSQFDIAPFATLRVTSASHGAAASAQPPPASAAAGARPAAPARR